MMIDFIEKFYTSNIYKIVAVFLVIVIYQFASFILRKRSDDEYVNKIQGESETSEK